MRLISIFAGIGGFDLAGQQAGLETVAHVERDAHCRKLLAAKWPDAVALDDVCTAGRHNLPQCDVLCGGWPCQDLSVAGKRAGLSGARSGLFYEFLRIAHELQPSFIVWENVPGLLSSDDGRDFARVLVSLAECGYFGATRILDAQHFGLAQRRRRVFGVFARGDIGAGCCAEILSLTEGVRGHPSPRREPGKDVAGTLSARASAGGGLGTDFELGGGQTATSPVAGAVSAKWAKGTGGSAGDECYNLTVGPLMTHSTPNGHGMAGANNQAAYSGHIIGVGPAAIYGTLRSHPHPGSNSNGSIVAFDTTQITCPANHSNPQPGDACHPLASGAHAPSIAYRTAGNCGPFEQGDKTACLNTATDPNQNIIATALAVRRLTPRECERLQGFQWRLADGSWSEDWTAGFSDSTRYKMLGNAVAVPVARWIFTRLKALATPLKTP